MPARQPRTKPWPQRWLMTDERMGENLWGALERLPRGSGVVFRHDRLNRTQRLRMGRRIAALAQRRGLVLAVAGDVVLAKVLGAELVHRPATRPIGLPHSMPVHDETEATEARRSGASIVFVSPVFPTGSHPGHAALGVGRAARLARMAGGKAIALGGMDEGRWRKLRQLFDGYAGIDCWLAKPSCDRIP